MYGHTLETMIYFYTVDVIKNDKLQKFILIYNNFGLLEISKLSLSPRSGLLYLPRGIDEIPKLIVSHKAVKCAKFYLNHIEDSLAIRQFLIQMETRYWMLFLIFLCTLLLQPVFAVMSLWNLVMTQLCIFCYWCLSEISITMVMCKKSILSYWCWLGFSECSNDIISDCIPLVYENVGDKSRFWLEVLSPLCWVGFLECKAAPAWTVFTSTSSNIETIVNECIATSNFGIFMCMVTSTYGYVLKCTFELESNYLTCFGNMIKSIYF